MTTKELKRLNRELINGDHSYDADEFYRVVCDSIEIKAEARKLRAELKAHKRCVKALGKILNRGEK
jgi:hypothetical protein